jgi:flagellar biosynthesis protein FliR
LSVYNFNDLEIILFFAALVRVGCLLIMLPLFSHIAIPGPAKVLFSFALTMILFPTAQARVSMDPSILDTSLGIALLVGREAMVGLVLGFIVKIFFESLSFAFSYMGMQMGFAMASQYDPHTETTTPVVSQLIMIIATLLMLATDTHHLMLKAMAESFQIIPIGTGTASKALVGYVMETANQLFVICVKISAPMALVIFLVNLAFGIVAKAVPQINVLVVSLSVNVIAGFVVLILILPTMGPNLHEVFSEMVSRMLEATRYLHG